jgi:hypothetical protein
MNKSVERSLVEKVYTLNRAWHIRDSESPDFICELSGKIVLGIEVTEYHHSETDARLQHIPEYFSELLDGKPIRHKDDKILKIGKVEIQDQNGRTKHKGVKAVIHGIPPVERRLELFAEIVEKKNLKCIAYLAHAPATDLLIDDHDHAYWFRDYASLYHSLLTNDRCRNALTTSNFRDVILATTAPGDDGNRRVVIPLKANMFAEHVQIFTQLFIDSAEKYGIKKEYDDFASILALLLNNLGLGNARIEFSTPTLSIHFASIEIRLSDAEGIVIRDHLCLPDSQCCGESASTIAQNPLDAHVQLATHLQTERCKLLSTIPLFYPIN